VTLYDHAAFELDRLGEDPELVSAILTTIHLIEEKHDLDRVAHGFMAGYFKFLLQGKPLTVLTSDPDEWEALHHPDKPSDDPLWISKRDRDAVSTNGGKTYFLMSEGAMADPEPPMIYTSISPDEVFKPETYADVLRLRNKKEHE
jgi:hypothetical protein